METPLRGTRIDSPVGGLELVRDALGALVHIRFLAEAGGHELEQRLGSTVARGEPDGDAAATQLGEYFARRRRSFELDVAPEGTPFQQHVWRELARIPYGETISYGELARRVGEPGASRAVGRANNQNPVPIVIPCHRVVGADGSLVGFGGGLTIKRALLDLERGQPSLFPPR